jgi:ATP-dependent Clp protease ATP-binding subunit ClpX
MARRIELPEPIHAPKEIFEELDRYVIGQDRAKKIVAIAAYNHFKRIYGSSKLLKKSNILMIGPTGCGKTHIARQLAKILDVPFAVVNATEYTEAGYYGKDVEIMISELLFAAGGDAAAAEKGVVFVDEIDKIASRSHGFITGAGARDIGGEGVQQALLKLLESNKVFAPLNLTQHWSKHDFVQVDVTNILFVCAGTFTDLGRGRYKADIGFSGESAESKRSRRRISARELEEYGLIAELLGRLPVVLEMNPLSHEEMGRIITDPPDSLLTEYRDLFSYEGIKIEMDSSGRDAIVDCAMKRMLGARGLRSIFEELFFDLSFEAPEHMGKTICVDREYVEERIK